LPDAQKNEAEADSALRNSNWATSISKRLNNIPPEQVPSKIEMLPAGSYKLDSSGSYIQKTPDGSGWQPIVDKTGAATPPIPNSYIAVDKNTGRVLDGTGLLNKDDYSLWNKKNINSDITSNRYANSLFNSQLKSYTDSQKAKQNNQTSSAISTLTNGNSQNSTNVAPDTDILKSSIQASLRLPQEHLDNVDSSIQDLKVQLDGYLAHPTTRASFVHTAAVSDTVNTMARAISDKQFDDNDATQSMYTSSHVSEYNKQLAQAVVEATGRADLVNEKSA